jgi:hypothetical protein
VTNVPYGISYAGAESDYDSANVYILGIPYDRTSSFRSGAREAPFHIRRASYNFEEIHFEHGLDLPQLSIFDQGDKTNLQHILDVDDEMYPEAYREIIRRLRKAMEDQKTRRAMELEDDIIKELQEKERQIEEGKKTIKEKEKEIKEKDNIIAELKRQKKKK